MPHPNIASQNHTEILNGKHPSLLLLGQRCMGVRNYHFEKCCGFMDVPWWIHRFMILTKSPVAPSSFRRQLVAATMKNLPIQGAPVLPMMNGAVNGMITPSMLWKADSLAKIFTRSFCKVESLIHNLPDKNLEKTKKLVVVIVVEPAIWKMYASQTLSSPHFFG